LSENTISYIKSLDGIHNISALAGFTYQDFTATSLLGSGSVFLSDNFETYNLAAAGTPGIPGSSYSKSTLMSYLGRINYNFKNKYLATVSFRADGSSKFSEGNKWGYFPSTALAWRVSDEEFLRGNSVISNLKLRTSWGVTGSQAIGPYVTLNQLYSGKTVFNDALYNSFAPGGSLPGDLKWETTGQLDFGFDLGLKDNRFMITADYYIKNTKDLLNTVTLPSSMGYTSTIQNVGEVQNKGFELGLGAKLLTGIFKWDMDINLSSNRNKVIKLYNGADILGGFINVVAIQDNINILREGQPIGCFYGYMEDGYDDTGHIKYKDLNPDGKMTPGDKTFIGDPNPDFICGINSNISFKNFELNIFLQGIYGNNLFNVSAVGYAADYGFGLNMLKEVLNNHWSPTNTDAKYPIISNKSTVNVSDRFVEDGSYLRVKNIQLAYNPPVNSLGFKWIKHLQLYVSGQNLLTLTKYNGWDPEVNSMGGASSTILGVDNKVYPMSKTMTIGIRARF
jgi:TonB-linked SusC/RagA family outer membrane protein